MPTKSNNRMVEFRTRNCGDITAGERCLLRLDAIVALFPSRRSIKTIEPGGWTLDVFEDDWPKVEKTFREYCR